MNPLLRPVLRFPKLTLLVVLAVSVFCAGQTRSLELETDMRNWIPADHPEARFDAATREAFSVRDSIVVGVERQGAGGIYTPEVLHLIAALSTAIEEIDGVVQGEVLSLATADNIVGTAAGMEVSPFMETVPDTAEDIAALRAAVRGNSMYAGQIVSHDEQAAIVLAKVSDAANREVLYGHVRDLLRDFSVPSDARVVLGGRIALEGAIAELIVSEMKRIAPLSIACMVLMLALVMRSPRGVVLPILVVILSVFVAYGTMALTGVKFYSMSTMIVTLLVAMGVADGIHMINAYAQHILEDPTADRATIVERTLEEMTGPVVMTSLTTAAGFFSLVFAPVLPIRAFGGFTAIGILAAMVFSLTLIPAGLMLLPLRAPRSYYRREAGLGGSRLDAVLAWFGRVVVAHPGRILAAAALVLAGGVVQALRLHIDSSLSGNIDAQNPAVIADAYLNAHFEGTSDLGVIFDGGAEDAIKDPALLRAIDDLQSYAETLPVVGGSVSIAEYLKRMHEVMHGDDPAFNRVPESRDLAAQYLLLYAMSGDSDDFDTVVDYDYRRARVRLNLKSDHSSVVIPVIESVRSYLRDRFPADRMPRFAGRANISRIMQELVVYGQLVTLLISLGIVYVLTTAMFRSPLGGLLTTLPIAIATVLNFGMLTQAGIPLGVGNSTLAAIGIGIGIDYAIHYMAKFRRLSARGVPFADAAFLTATTTGRAILFNALVVAAGYLVNLASRFPPTVTLGAIVSFNMGTSFLAALLVIPVFIGLLRPRFLWAAPRSDATVPPAALSSET